MVGQTQIDRWLVEQGWALPYLNYGGKICQEAEAQAKAAQRGLHAGTYQNPWDYRRNPGSSPTAGTARAALPAGDGSARHFATCQDARRAGAAPVRRGRPGYGAHLDRDGDGIGCE